MQMKLGISTISTKVRMFVLRTRELPWLAKVLLAVFVVLCVSLFKHFMDARIESATPFVLYTLGVLICALIGGFRMGTLAAFISAVLGRYFFIEPVHTFHVANERDIIRLVIFLIEGMVISGISSLLRASIYDAQEMVEKIQDKDIEITEAQSRFKTVADSAPVLIWMSGPDKYKNFFNQRWLNFTGRELEEEVGEGWKEGIFPEDFSNTLNVYSKAFEKREEFKIEHRLRRWDGEYRWVLNHGVPNYNNRGVFMGYIGSAVDITDRREAEKKIHYHANHDALTGLPNRKRIEDQFSDVVIDAMRSHTQVAVMYVDLDRFKNINDTLGHFIGDTILKEVAFRFADSVREIDLVGRIGGDEFLIVLTSVRSSKDTGEMAKKILSILDDPFRVEDQSLHLTTSIGIAMYPQDGQDISALLKNADVALYRAKDSGRNRFQFYNSMMNLESYARLNLENDMRKAVREREFVLHYQPIVNAKGALMGIEALVRWQHPRLGLLPPSEFIPLAEENGMIVQIGEWIVSEVANFHSSLIAKGLTECRAAVNFSMRQFAEFDLVANLERSLMLGNLEPKYLTIEITESIAMANTERSNSKFKNLIDLGIAISIDDFGTGYSSLSYLRNFPVQSLKIDQSFVRHCLDNEQDKSIIRAIISMGHSLGIKVIAEGVENKEQYDFLVQLGCDGMQGYYIERPIPGGKLVEWLEKKRQMVLV